MEYQILVAIAAIVLALVVLLIVLVRKKQPRLNTKHIDFISIIGMFVGLFALSILLTNASNTKPELNDTITNLILIIYPIMLVLFAAVFVVQYFRKGSINSTVGDDERTEISNTKSARNALLGTNVALMAYILGTNTLSQGALIVILFTGYIVYFSSLIVYYFWKA